MTAEAEQDGSAAPARSRLRGGLAWVAAGLLILFTLLLVVGVVGRFALTTDGGRGFLAERLQGLKVGRLGRLELEGIGGDPFSVLTIHRAAIRDGQGVWAEARNVRVAWNAGALSRRLVHLRTVDAARVVVYRRPVQTPPGPKRRSPVAVQLDSLQALLETKAAATSRDGLYEVRIAGLRNDRDGGVKGQASAVSRLHAGDRLQAAFDLGASKTILLDLDVVEGQGGAIAGALGLAADRPFEASIDVNGRIDQGFFRARSRSGDRAPIVGEGGWSAAGGQGRLQLDLAASSLTRDLLRGIGPTLAVQASTGAERDGVRRIDARATAENLALTLVGPVRTKGDVQLRDLALDLRVPQVARWLEPESGPPLLGPGRISGRLSGPADDLRLTGDLAVQAFQTPDYRLQRLAGPLTLRRKGEELFLNAELQGDGGGGKGLPAAALGTRPTLALDGQRLRDGRILIRSLRLEGPGLRLAGDGTRTLFGGLSFKGQAALTRLEQVSPGASGQVAGDLTAGQAGPGKPWDFRFDGRGQRFATGLAEVDRLLGATPRVEGRAALLPGGDVRLDRAALTGAKASAETKGVIAKGGVLRLALDWRATGPFRAGPIEVAGQAQGTGALTGTAAAPRADLQSRFERIDFPQLPVTDARLHLVFASLPGGGDGLFELTGASAYGPARARSDFRFVEGGVQLSGLDANAGGVQATGAVSLQRGAPVSADLRVAAGPGAFLAQGRLSAIARIVDRPGGAVAVLAVTGADLVPRDSTLSLKTLRLDADGPLARLPYTVAATGSQAQTPFRLDGSGTFSQATRPGAANSLTFAGSGRVRRVDFRTLEPALVTFAGPERSARLRLATGGGRAVIDARQGAETIAVRADLDGVDLSALGEDLAGKVNADLTLNGRGRSVTGQLTAQLDGARSRDAPANLALNSRVQASLAGERLNLEVTATNVQGLRSAATAVLPVEASAAPFRVAVARTRPISGRFSADGELKPLWDVFVGGEQSLSGKLQASGTFGGTLNDPQVTGGATLASGGFEDAATGLKLRDMTLSAAFGARAVEVRQFIAKDAGSGAVNGSGSIGLARGSGSSFRLDLNRFRLIDNDQVEALASGQATVVRGGDGKVALTGALTIDRAEINAASTQTASNVVTIEVVERNKPGGQLLGAQAPTRPAGPAIALDVNLRAPRGIYVRGRGLDLELSLDAKVGGSTSSPTLDGTANVVRGDFEFAGKRFEFDDRGVIRLATQPERIRLDLSATRNDPALTATVRILGTAARPQISLTSIPVLPNDEVLSQVLFGRSASQLSPIEAAQLAASLSALAGGAGFDVIGNLRHFAGLDRLAFGGDAATGVTVSGGKYLTDDLYLELTGGGRDGPVASLEWRVRRNLSLGARFGGQNTSQTTSAAQGSDARLTVRYRRDW